MLPASVNFRVEIDARHLRSRVRLSKRLRLHLDHLCCIFFLRLRRRLLRGKRCPLKRPNRREQRDNEGFQLLFSVLFWGIPTCAREIIARKIQGYTVFFNKIFSISACPSDVWSNNPDVRLFRMQARGKKNPAQGRVGRPGGIERGHTTTRSAQAVATARPPRRKY